MKKVVLVTDVKYWRQGAGHRSRIRTLVDFLKFHSLLHVAFVGLEEEWVKKHLLENINQYKIVFFSDGVDNRDCCDYIIRIGANACIVEYLYLVQVIELLPSKVITFIDTHDLISQKAISFESFDVPNDKIDIETEIELLCKFDYIILISKSEYDILAKENVNKERLILCQHPAKFHKRKIRRNVSVIGFIGSEYYPNIDAMNWFIEHVWPHIDSSGLVLRVFGKVCDGLDRPADCSNIELMGFVKDIDLAYEAVDVMVNPVRMGSGLKIKNAETLANGLPLITTSHGASGFLPSKERVLVIADSANEFIMELSKLICSYKSRFELASAGYKYSRRNFTAKNCFAKLIDSINEA